MKWKPYRIPAVVVTGMALAVLSGLYAYACTYVYLEPSLPTLPQMRHVKLKVPLRIYTVGGDLISQIGVEQRTPVRFDQVPLVVREAFLAAEDHRFYQEGAVNLGSLMRAVLVDVIEGRKAQGGSTITMEAARNLFLTLSKTWRRKLQESFVAYRLDHDFTKDEVFQLYLNVIYFGERAYGVAAAAQTYFGQPLGQLTLAQTATLAGLVQAPSLYNPIVHPHLAALRRSYVLTRMLDLGYIDSARAQTADQAPITAHLHAPPVDVPAPYVAEMVREQMLQQFGPAAETAGYRVYTTLDGRLQVAAQRAVQLGLIAYDRRHGWRGPIGRTVLLAKATPTQLQTVVDEYAPIGVLSPAVVTRVGRQDASVYVRSHGIGRIDWSGLAWARKEQSMDALGPAPKTASDVLSRGDVVYVVWKGKGAAKLAQVPQAQAALVSLDPDDGAIAALVGGFDYFTSKFNRATSAERQPGSGFKPFYYSAALHKGYTASTTFLDTPLVVGGSDTETTWRPENDSGLFGGAVRLRVALAHSLNLVSIRLMRALGVPYVSQYASRFGFDPKTLPQNLTLALGSLDVTPLEMAAGYAVFSNGGYQIEPYLIDRIVNASGKVIWQATPRIACHGCNQKASLSELKPPSDPRAPLSGASALRGDGAAYMPPNRIAPRVISADNDFIMTSMMQDVIKNGTGVRALSLHRDDIAGKTGTSNQWRDAWFNGFTPTLEATVWAGFDDDHSLGYDEEGAHVALPIWIRFMRQALKGVPQYQRPMPPGIVTLRVSPKTGLLVSDENPQGVPEIFMAHHLPGAQPNSQSSQSSSSAASIF